MKSCQGSGAISASGFATAVVLLCTANTHSALANPFFEAVVRSFGEGIQINSGTTPVVAALPNVTALASSQLVSSNLAVVNGAMAADAFFQQNFINPFPPGVTSVTIQQSYRATGDFVTDPLPSGFFRGNFVAGFSINGFFYGFQSVIQDNGIKFVGQYRADTLVRTFNRFFGTYTVRETINPSGVFALSYLRSASCIISTGLPVGPGDGLCAVNLALLPNRSSSSASLAVPGGPGVAAVAAPGALGLLGLGLGFLALRGRGAAARLSAAA